MRLENGAPLFYFQNEDMSRHDILERGNDALLIVLPAPVRLGEEIRLEVRYHGNVISSAGNGVEFVGERGTWFAHVGGGDHFALFDLTFRWPKRLTLVATGVRTDLHDDGDVKTGRWQSRVPFAVAGFNLGEYKDGNCGGRSSEGGIVRKQTARGCDPGVASEESQRQHIDSWDVSVAKATRIIGRDSRSADRRVLLLC